jgi:hypothetical protein
MALVQPLYNPAYEAGSPWIVGYLDGFLGLRSKMNMRIFEQNLRSKASDTELLRMIRELQRERSNLIRDKARLALEYSRADARVRTAAENASARSASRATSDAARLQAQRNDEWAREADSARRTKERYDAVFSLDATTLADIGGFRDAVRQSESANKRIPDSQWVESFRVVSGQDPFKTSGSMAGQGAAAFLEMYEVVRADHGRELAEKFRAAVFTARGRPNVSVEELERMYMRDEGAVTRHMREHMEGWDIGKGVGAHRSGDPDRREGSNRQIEWGAENPLTQSSDDLDEAISQIDAEIANVKKQREDNRLQSNMFEGIHLNFVTSNPFTKVDPEQQALVNIVSSMSPDQREEFFGTLAGHSRPGEALAWAIENQWPPEPGVGGPLVGEEPLEGEFPEEAMFQAIEPQRIPPAESSDMVVSGLEGIDPLLVAGSGDAMPMFNDLVLSLEQAGGASDVATADALSAAQQRYAEHGDLEEFRAELRSIYNAQAPEGLSRRRATAEDEERLEQIRQATVPAWVRENLFDARKIYELRNELVDESERVGSDLVKWQVISETSPSAEYRQEAMAANDSTAGYAGGLSELLEDLNSIIEYGSGYDYWLYNMDAQRRNRMLDTIENYHTTRMVAERSRVRFADLEQERLQGEIDAATRDTGADSVFTQGLLQELQDAEQRRSDSIFMENFLAKELAEISPAARSAADRAEAGLQEPVRPALAEGAPFEFPQTVSILGEDRPLAREGVDVDALVAEHDFEKAIRSLEFPSAIDELRESERDAQLEDVQFAPLSAADFSAVGPSWIDDVSQMFDVDPGEEELASVRRRLSAMTPREEHEVQFTSEGLDAWEKFLNMQDAAGAPGFENRQGNRQVIENLRRVQTHPLRDLVVAANLAAVAARTGEGAEEARQAIWKARRDLMVGGQDQIAAMSSKEGIEVQSQSVHLLMALGEPGENVSSWVDALDAQEEALAQEVLPPEPEPMVEVDSDDLDEDTGL